MAGITDSIPTKTGMPQISLDDPFATMNGLLEEIRDALTGRDKDAMQLDLVSSATVRQSTHVRFRTDVLVFSGDGAMTVTLTVGLRTWTFNLPGADVRVVPLGIVIERGVDISFTASAGNVTGYLLGTRE